MFALIVIYMLLFSPWPLLAVAWSQRNRLPIEYSILTLTAVLLVSATIPGVKLVLLGSDYSHRLFTTIEMSFLIALALAIRLGIKRRWIAAVAAIILAFGWMVMGSINTVV